MQNNDTFSKLIKKHVTQGKKRKHSHGEHDADSDSESDFEEEEATEKKKPASEKKVCSRLWLHYGVVVGGVVVAAVH